MTIWPDWSRSVQLPNGAYMRLEDYCNSQEHGANLFYTASMVMMEEELLFHELGLRPYSWIVQGAIGHWTPLDDLLAEHVLRLS